MAEQQSTSAEEKAHESSQVIGSLLITWAFALLMTPLPSSLNPDKHLLELQVDTRTRGGEEAQGFHQPLALILIILAFALLGAQPPQPAGSQLLFELYAASMLLTFSTGIALLAPSILSPGAPSTMMARHQNSATWVAGASLLQVFVLGCFPEFPRSSVLIRAGLLFMATWIIHTAPPLLLDWINPKATSTPVNESTSAAPPPAKDSHIYANI